MPRASRAASYEPGAWLAISGERSWVLAALDPSSPLARACFEAVTAGAEPGAVHQLLAEGGSPGFAIATADGTDTRLLLAGTTVADADTVDGATSRWTATNAPSGAEQRVGAAMRIRLSAGDHTAPPGPSLPLAAGMAFASSLTIIDPTAVPPPVPLTPRTPPEPLAPAPMPSDLNSGPRSTATAPAPPDSPSATEPEPVASPPPVRAETMQPPRPDGLIDSVPWTIAGAAPPPPPTGRPLAVPPPTGYPQAPASPPPAEPQQVAGQETLDGPAEPPPAQPAAGNPLGWVSAAPVTASETIYPPPRDPAAPPPPTAPEAAPPSGSLAPPTNLGQPLPPFEPSPPNVPPAYGPPPGYGPPPPPAPPAPAPPPQAAPPVTGPPGAPTAATEGPEQTVLAVVCPYGHLSPPYAGGCRVCSTPIAAQEPFQTLRPVLGILNLSTGDIVTLDRDVILGRAPSAPQHEPHRRPHVVRLASPGNDISRTHVEVRLDGWHVLVTDLGSTNGTVATLPGQPPLRLRAHDALAIVPGTIVSIADEVSFRYEVPA